MIAGWPAPEVACRVAEASEIPAGARAMAKVAAGAGWRVEATYARGTTPTGRPVRSRQMTEAPAVRVLRVRPGEVVEALAARMRSGAPGKVVDSLALRMRRGPRGAFAVWTDGRYVMGVMFGDRFPALCNATQLRAELVA